jgi:hypothetical protein
MALDISGQIAQLPDFSRQQLLDLWLNIYGRAAPPGIRRELMVPFLAYRMQEQAHGGLKHATRSRLLRIARALEKSPSAGELPITPENKPGTCIVRQWRGKTLEVTVTENGYEYQGSTFNSLSEIARKITGTQWSGPAFFGLKRRSPVKEHSDG